MMTRRLLAIGLWLWASPCGASDQVMMGTILNTVDTGSAEYANFNGLSNATNNRNDKICTMPTGGTLSALRILVDTDPDNGVGVDSYQFDVMDGTATTGIVCTVADGATSCQDSTNTYAVVATDAISLRSTPSGTPATTVVSFSLNFDGTTAAESLLCGGSGVDSLSATVTRYVSVAGNRSAQATEQRQETVIPTSGTVKSLYVEIDGAPDTGVGTQEYVVTVRQNTAGTALTCTISEAATTCSDVSNSFTVVAGDVITVEYVPSASAPTARGVNYNSVVFLADTDGEFILTAVDQSLNNAAARYAAVVGTGGINATETVVDDPGQAFTVQNMYVQLSGTPGAGNSYQFDFRLGAADASATFTCTISDSATACNDTESIAIANDNLLDTEITPASSPTGRTASISYRGFISQAGAARRVMLITQEDSCGRLWPFFCSSRN